MLVNVFINNVRFYRISIIMQVLKLNFNTIPFFIHKHLIKESNINCCVSYLVGLLVMKPDQTF